MFRFPARFGALVLLLAAAAQAQAPAVSWQRLDGPFGGPALGVASAAGVAVATNGPDLFRSTDGATWARVALDRSGFSGVYAAPDGSFWTLGQTVLRSRDGGQTWLGAGGGLPENGAAALSAGAGGVLFAATTEGVYRLPAGSAFWARTGLAGLARAVAARADGVVLAGTSGEAFPNGFAVQRSADNGLTWTLVPLPLQAYAAVSALAFLPDGTALAGGRSLPKGYARPGLFRSADGGLTWAAVASLTEVETLALISAGGTVFTLTYDGPFRSADGGATWTRAGVGLNDATAAADGSLLLASTRLGILRSQDGGATAADATEGFGHAIVGHIVAGVGGTVFAASADDYGAGTGLYRSGDRGITWGRVPLDFAPTGLSALLLDSGGRLFATPALLGLASPPPGGVYRSLDAGATWQPTPLVGTGVLTAPHLAEGPAGVLWAITRDRTASRAVLFRSLDGGTTWEERVAPPVGSTFTAGPDGTLWAGSNQPDVRVARSTDGGASWTIVLDASIGLRTGDIVAGDGSVVVSAQGVAYQSADRGETWQAVDLGLTHRYDEARSFARGPGRVLYAAADGGRPVHRSRDGGQTWETVSAGLPDGLPFIDIAPGPDGTLWLATAGGLYRADADRLTAAEAPGTAAALALTARPNPVRGGAAVSLALPAAEAAVRVSVADVLGREVAVLHDGPAPAGVLALSLDATRLPAGTYVVRAVAGRTAAAQRLVVVR